MCARVDAARSPSSISPHRFWVAEIYKDGAVFPRPGLAGVPHVQHMGTMDVSWAFTSPPPRAWLWWASRAEGRLSIYRGWGHRGLRPGLRTPLLNGGGPGVSLPAGVTGVGPLWWGAPPGRSRGRVPKDLSPPLVTYCAKRGRSVHRSRSCVRLHHLSSFEHSRKSRSRSVTFRSTPVTQHGTCVM